MTEQLIFHTLKIRGFRNLGNLDLAFELPEPGRHTSHLLVGGQSSGKTAVMTALFALFDRNEDLLGRGSDWTNPFKLVWDDFKTPSFIELVAEISGKGMFEFRLELDSIPNPKNPSYPETIKVFSCRTPHGSVSTEEKFPSKFWHTDPVLRSSGDRSKVNQEISALDHMVEFWIPKPHSMQWHSLIYGEGLRASKSPLQEKILTAYFGVPSKFVVEKSRSGGHEEYCSISRDGVCSSTSREANFINLLTTLLGSYDPGRTRYLLVDDLVESFGSRALPILQGMLPWVSVLATQSDWQKVSLLEGALEPPAEGDAMEIWAGTLRKRGSWEFMSPVPVKSHDKPHKSECRCQDCQQVDAENRGA